MSIKTILLASAATIVAGNVFAADIVPSYEAPVAVPAYAFSWSGAYVGVNLGYGGGDFDHPLVIEDLASATLGISASGFLGGVQAGYNWQSGSMVYGVEADFQGSAIDATVGVDISNPNGPEYISGELGTEVEWFGTIRARAGVAATDRLLAYVTGGAAYGRTNSFVSLDGSSISEDFPNVSENVKNTEWGWTVGAGVEYAATDNITLKTEYLYTDLGKATLISVPGASLENDVSFHTVRVGLNYKF